VYGYDLKFWLEEKLRLNCTFRFLCIYVIKQACNITSVAIELLV